ncbi:disease resistance protein RUN1-like [Eucalyptus grandis]|uniref:disease resistance protein RUN1-like n=1 Tax=Eucalyptus grandis TaxID=71139 RepID=UPI00192EB9C5|nr:disease resistance protein RUN1-like [Eucalyptus grandis]XP_039172389.1 disease resistance protein RUN1-like [Eucalyptus grandis]
MDKEQSQRKRVEEESTQGASSSSSISSEATNLCSDQYDVFLSFNGSDTRKTFTDHLYHSLFKVGTVPFCVFRDENSILIGEEFGSKILDAIVRSKISIPVISENYASSKWCLRELIHIMNYKKSASHVVLPIFYKVAPSEVRHLKGNFGNAFHSSRERFDEKDIQEGQQALNEVSYLNGWESQKIADGHEGKLIEHVVETVISKLREFFQLDMPEQLVGLDDRMKEILNWIDNPSINARMIGIYGMGGIGKTTLAKCIYNQLSNKFVHVSFLPNVRETTRRHGITYLQSQLISDILQNKSEVSRIDDGISIIKSRFKGKKVLILLDDIDDKSQLDALARECHWFMVGSVIIVTTRNKAILDQSKFEVDYKYELKELDKVQTLLLFNRHAFRMDHSLREFEGISRDIISNMGGLPLALQVVGSYLYKKMNRQVWEDVREQLKNEPHRDVQKILQISYDALEDGNKQNFLDIVCFFIGKERRFAMYMWEDCGLYPSQGIEELKLRCLIKMRDDGRFEMHDQLRDLGRSIFLPRTTA